MACPRLKRYAVQFHPEAEAGYAVLRSFMEKA
jgi:imidazoleglycerol phosphate synthase glutamine amidotransferase subunit HisH